MIHIYTDGASSPKQESHCGGWAAIINENGIITEISGGEFPTTNQRMEMLSAIKALEYFKDRKDITIYSDSAYLVNCFLQKWYVKWQRNGWINSSEKPVVNKDLWERLLELNKIHNVTFSKVKGHANDELNNRVDKLAVEAKERIKNDK